MYLALESGVPMETWLDDERAMETALDILSKTKESSDSKGRVMSG